MGVRWTPAGTDGAPLVDPGRVPEDGLHRDTPVRKEPEGPITVVIPALDDAGHLDATLTTLAGAGQVEVLLVDGGSTDDTVRIATRRGCRVLHSSPGRALQMNAGARAARGTILLFLHADTRLPAGFEDPVRRALQRPGVVAGAFRLRIDAPGSSYRLIERGVSLRSRYLQLPYGDQALFVRTETFLTMGGFADLPIMEDFDLVRRLRGTGRIVQLSEAILTSPRRWSRLGPWRTTWINQKIIAGYHLGLAPSRLAAWYRADASGPGPAGRR